MEEEEKTKKEIKKIIILVFVILFAILATYLIGLKFVMFGLTKTKTRIVEKQLETIETIEENKNTTIGDMLNSARKFVNQNEI